MLNSLPSFFISLSSLLIGFGCTEHTKPADTPLTQVQFIVSLYEAVNLKDTSAIYSALHDTIFESNDICGYPGCTKAEFMRFHFQTGDGLDGDWKLLKEILDVGFTFNSHNVSYGGVRLDSILMAPDFMMELNWSEELVAIQSTSIKEKPYSSARTIMTADVNDIFACNCCIYTQNDNTIIQDSSGVIWHEIYLADQLIAYIDLNATSQKFYKVFEIGKINGHWKILTWYTGEPC